MAACLLKLLDNLHFISRNSFFVKQTDIFNMTIIKDKIVNIVAVNLAGFIDNAIAWSIYVLFLKTRPLSVGKLYFIKPL